MRRSRLPSPGRRHRPSLPAHAPPSSTRRGARRGRLPPMPGKPLPLLPPPAPHRPRRLPVRWWRLRHPVDCVAQTLHHSCPGFVRRRSASLSCSSLSPFSYSLHCLSGSCLCHFHINQHRLVRILAAQCHLQGITQGRGIGHAQRGATLRLRQSDKIDRRQFRTLHHVRRTETKHRRKILQRCIAAAVENHEGDRQLHLRRAPQLLDRIHARAVAEDTDDASVWLSQRHTQRRRHTVAQPAAIHRKKSLALRDRQIVLHHRARTRCFFYDDVGRLAQLCQRLHHICHRQWRCWLCTRTRYTRRG